MATWIFALIAAGIACAWWGAHRRFVRHWEHLSQLLRELADGRTPRNFVFRNGGRFSRLTEPLEKIAREQERVHAEKSSEEFNLRTILASMEEGVMVVDAHHIIGLINPSFRRLFDLKIDPRGQTVLRALREPQFEEMVTAALKTGEVQARDVSPTGRPPRHFSVHAVPMRDQAGGPGVVAIFRDVSRLKQLEDVRRDFVANVSHELRTPLSIFHGYLENLSDDPTMPRKEQAEIFEILRKHSMRLNALIEDLLALARLESRVETLETEPIDVEKFVRAVFADWESKIAKKQLSLELEVAADLPPLAADPRRLVQVLNNLLENAVKYTEQGGKIRVRAMESGGRIEMRVEDTGMGIPPSDLPHIFERFYRADKARSREQGGTGLGLSIVKHIVQSHGGSVTAESKYGQGTAIILHFPLRAQEAADAPFKNADSADAARPSRGG